MDEAEQNLERITQDEYEETFVNTMKTARDYLITLMNNYQEYIEHKESGKYNMTFYRLGDTLYYSKTKKEMGFKSQ